MLHEALNKYLSTNIVVVRHLGGLSAALPNPGLPYQLEAKANYHHNYISKIRVT
jgi:hypothetical protein